MTTTDTALPADVVDAGSVDREVGPTPVPGGETP